MKSEDLDLREVTPIGKNFKMTVGLAHYDHYRNNAFENFTTELLLNRSIDGMLFVDVGAHYGYYTMLVGTSFTSCRIVSFEPVPVSFEVLTKNTSANGIKNIELYNYAVSDLAGKKELLIAERTSQSGFSEHYLSRTAEKIEVQIVSLDDIIQVEPSTPVRIKIDVEGHEINVLDGMKNIVNNSSNIELFIEFHPGMLKASGHQPQDLLDKVVSMGFDIYFIDDERRETYKLSDTANWSHYFGEGNFKKDHFNILCIKKERSLNICVFSHSSQFAGAERSLLEMANELVKDHGAVCTVVLPVDGPLNNELQKIGSSILTIDYNWWCDLYPFSCDEAEARLMHSLKELFGKIDKLNKINPDIILTNSIVIPWGAITASVLNKPHIWHIREFGVLDHNLQFYLPFDEVLQIIRSSNLIFTNSDAVKNALNLNILGNAITLYNHIDIPHESVLENSVEYFTRPSATKLILVGNISKPKGQEEAVSAVKKLIEDKHDVELVLLGASEPNYLEHLKKKIMDEGLEPYVKIFNFSMNPYSAINQADILLLCSRNEAFGRVLVEGMLLKKPVIGTKSGGAQEVILEGFNGLLYTPGDINQLVEKLTYLITHPDERKKFGENGFAYVKEQFSKEQYGGEAYRRFAAFKSSGNISQSPLTTFVISIMSRALDSELKISRSLKNIVNEQGMRIDQLDINIKSEDEVISKLERIIFNKDAQISHLEQTIIEKDVQISTIEEKEKESTKQLADIHSSITWRMTQKLQRFIDVTMPEGSRRRNSYTILLRGGRSLANNGLKGSILRYRLQKKQDMTVLSEYEKWISLNEPDSQKLKEQMFTSSQFAYRPLISIITPVYNTPIHILSETIQSVIDQTYDNWELCIVDGNSDGPGIRKLLTDFAKKDHRIKIKLIDRNFGISGNTNEAIKMVMGEFVTFLDHDDLITPFALYEAVSALNADHGIDVMYSDKDLVSEDGKKRFQPLFKPDWSPEIMWSANYLAHMCFIRKTLIDSVGEFLPATDGAQDWDLYFKIMEKTDKFYHIPKVLYHWRTISTSCAEQGDKAKPYIFKAQQAAIAGHLARTGEQAEVVFIPPGIWRLKWTLRERPLVSIIIPTRNLKLLKACLDSILEKATYDRYEIIVLDTGIDLQSLDQEYQDYYRKISEHPIIRILKYDQPFNYSAVNNYGVRHAKGDVFLFLNDDTEVITPDLLEELLGWVTQKGIGAVGAKLLKPDNTIQHAGIVVGLGGFAGHPFTGVHDGYFGVSGGTEWYRDYLAVTGACTMVTRKVFEEIGGFDESFILCGSDVVLCLNIWKKGYRIVYTPFAKLYHHEAVTRGKAIPANDFIRSYEAYKLFLERGDPYYNSNLSSWEAVPSIRKSDEKSSLVFVEEYVKEVAKHES